VVVRCLPFCDLGGFQISADEGERKLSTRIICVGLGDHLKAKSHAKVLSSRTDLAGREATLVLDMQYSFPIDAAYAADITKVPTLLRLAFHCVDPKWLLGI
jgi:hypothetical protein